MLKLGTKVRVNKEGVIKNMVGYEGHIFEIYEYPIGSNLQWYRVRATNEGKWAEGINDEGKKTLFKLWKAGDQMSFGKDFIEELPDTGIHYTDNGQATFI